MINRENDERVIEQNQKVVEGLRDTGIAVGALNKKLAKLNSHIKTFSDSTDRNSRAMRWLTGAIVLIATIDLAVRFSPLTSLFVYLKSLL